MPIAEEATVLSLGTSSMNTALSPCQRLVLGEKHQHAPAENQKEAVGFLAKVECGVEGQGIHGKNHARPFSGPHFVPMETKGSAISPMHHSSVTGQMSLSTWHHAHVPLGFQPQSPSLGVTKPGRAGCKVLPEDTLDLPGGLLRGGGI